MVRHPFHRLAAWYGRKRMASRLALIALPLMLLGTYVIARDAALRSADHLTISVMPEHLGNQTPIFQRTFGAPLAMDAQRLLNDVATPIAESHLQDLGDNLSNYSGPVWQYHLAFTWHGVVIETADMLYDGNPEFFTVSVLGLPEMKKRSAVSGSAKGRYPILTNLVRDSSGSIPMPPA